MGQVPRMPRPGRVPVTEQALWSEGKPLPRETLPEGPGCGSPLGRGGSAALGHCRSEACPVTSGSLLSAKPEAGQQTPFSWSLRTLTCPFLTPGTPGPVPAMSAQRVTLPLHPLHESSRPGPLLTPSSHPHGSFSHLGRLLAPKSRPRRARPGPPCWRDVSSPLPDGRSSCLSAQPSLQHGAGCSPRSPRKLCQVGSRARPCPVLCAQVTAELRGPLSP